MMGESHLVQMKTERFRTSLDPLWVRMRHLLIERELDPLSMVLAYYEEEDFRFRFGILVGQDRRVYQFAFDFACRKSREGVFSEWREITDTWEESPFRRQVAQALEIAGRETRDLRS